MVFFHKHSTYEWQILPITKAFMSNLYTARERVKCEERFSQHLDGGTGMESVLVPRWRSAGIQALVKHLAHSTTASRERNHLQIPPSHQPCEAHSDLEMEPQWLTLILQSTLLVLFHGESGPTLQVSCPFKPRSKVPRTGIGWEVGGGEA